MAAEHGVALLDPLPYDPDLEAALGDVASLRHTSLFAAAVGLADAVIAAGPGREPPGGR